MKYAVFSDLHINSYKKYDSNGSRMFNCLSALEDIFRISHIRGITKILFAGDFFDQQKALSIEVIVATTYTLKTVFEKYPKIKLVMISGNHDQSEKNTLDNEALNSIIYLDLIFPNIELIDNSAISLSENVVVYGIPYYSYKEHFYAMYNALDLDAAKINILLMHQTPKHKNPMIPFDVEPQHFEKFDYVFCGHIHTREQLTKNFALVGSPLHRDLGDLGETKGFLILDTYSLHCEFVELDYPKFVNTENVDISKDDYVMPAVVKSVDEAPEDEFNYSEEHSKLVTKFCKTVPEGEKYLEIGLKIIK